MQADTPPPRLLLQPNRLSGRVRLFLLILAEFFGKRDRPATGPRTGRALHACNHTSAECYGCDEGPMFEENIALIAEARSKKSIDTQSNRLDEPDPEDVVADATDKHSL